MPKPLKCVHGVEITSSCYQCNGSSVVMVIPPDEEHNCNFDVPLGGNRLPALGTLARCVGCKRWWCFDVTNGSYSFGPCWFPIRWYHRKLRKRIEQYGGGQ